MLEKAVVFNQSEDITGCLLHHQGKFVQLIEGQKEVVRQLYGRIREDERHKDIVLLYSESNPVRMFSDWNMVFSDLNDITEQVAHKRALFDEIFHVSDAISTPGRSKLTLWLEVNKLLHRERDQ